MRNPERAEFISPEGVERFETALKSIMVPNKVRVQVKADPIYIRGELRGYRATFKMHHAGRVISAGLVSDDMVEQYMG